MENEKRDFELKAIIDQLSSQYSVYRDETRLYLQLIFGSASVFGLILYWEMSPGPRPMLWMILPLTVVSFAGLFALMMVFMGIVSSYTEMLEHKLNFLLGNRNDVFMYESYYIGFFTSAYKAPKPSERGFWHFIVLWIFTSLMPLLLCGYAIWKLWGFYPRGACLMGFFVIAAMGIILWCGIRIVVLRRKDNDRLFAEWKERFKVLPNGTDSGQPRI